MESTTANRFGVINTFIAFIAFTLALVMAFKAVTAQPPWAGTAGHSAAGAGAADFAKKNGAAPRVPDAEIEANIAEALAPFDREKGENPFEVQAALQEVMQNEAGIIREEATLKRALAGLEKLKQRAAKVGVTGNREYNPGWNTAIDLKSLLIVSEVVARAGLERTESRGAHSRLDHQASDPKQERMEIAIKKEGSEMQVVRRRQPDLPPDLKKIIEEGA